MQKALRVRKEDGQEAKRALLLAGLLDRNARISRHGEFIDLPLLDGFVVGANATAATGTAVSIGAAANVAGEISAAAAEGGNLPLPIGYGIVDVKTVSRGPPRDPFDRITYLILQAGFSKSVLEHLPDKWEKLGWVLVLKLTDGLRRLAPAGQAKVYETYATVLSCKSVVEDVSGIAGERREPGSRVLWGNPDTETVHVENGIRYKLDPLKVMFSSGNVDERIRYASFDCRGETVVDMFAGIGYFTLPLAVYGKPGKLYACEINPNAYQYLCENAKLNGVEDIVEPLLGDNRETAPEGIADRISMGYVGTTHLFLDKAMRVLKKEGGIIHYHETCPNELMKTQPLERVRSAAAKAGFGARLLNFKNVKSYSPGVSHVVIDVEIRCGDDCGRAGLKLDKGERQ